MTYTVCVGEIGDILTVILVSIICGPVILIILCYICIYECIKIARLCVRVKEYVLHFITYAWNTDLAAMASALKVMTLILTLARMSDSLLETLVYLKCNSDG